MLVAGPSGSGKTTFIKRLIERSSSVCTHPPVEIIYCYGIYQEAFEDIRGVRFHEGFVGLDQIPNDGKHR